ncbi:MAG: SUMF1/EgtB/PvdO family nonheme iron enzyme [Bacteroidota bacterium]
MKYTIQILHLLAIVCFSCQSQQMPQGETNSVDREVRMLAPKMVWVPKGELSDTIVKGFWMDETPVTVSQFKEFIHATQYITQAEKFGDGGVFDFEKKEWYLQSGANWRYPKGPEKEEAIDDHPVTQVSWNDAVAYAQWANKRLPTRWEWEHAARNAQNVRTTYSWGNDLREGEKWRANFWQGEFPFFNTVEDRFLTTSPVKTFDPTVLGLFDMAGNVWEWVEDDSPIERSQTGPEKIARGGSFLCDLDVCHGFQIGGETSSTPETALFHTGFRCVKDSL